MCAADDRWYTVQREELMEVARSNNFVIKYDKFDWNLHLTKVCLLHSSTSLRECTQHFHPQPLAAVWSIGLTHMHAGVLGGVAAAATAHREPRAAQPLRRRPVTNNAGVKPSLHPVAARIRQRQRPGGHQSLQPAAAAAAAAEAGGRGSERRRPPAVQCASRRAAAWCWPAGPRSAERGAANGRVHVLIYAFVHASCCRLRPHASALAVLTNTTARSHEHRLTLTDSADDADRILKTRWTSCYRYQHSLDHL